MLLQEQLEADVEEDAFEGAVAAVGARLVHESRGSDDIEVTVGHASLPHARELDYHGFSHSLHRILAVKIVSHQLLLVVQWEGFDD